MSQTADLGNKPPCRRDDALAVLQHLRQSGHTAYFAGGCVRDLLLGIEPSDYDIATDAPPQRVRQLFRSTQAVGQAFGVVLVRLGGSTIEVATFRSEGPYRDGRHPESVRFATPQEDAQRRDFTINGLFLDPVDNRVIDYVEGQADLRARRLRAIGQADQRFEEDHLRLLRAVRFAARFQLTIEAQTTEAIGRHAAQLVRISPERIADELRRMLTPVTRVAAWPMLWDLGLVPPIFRFLKPLEAVQLRIDDSVFLVLAPGEPTEFGLALAAACLDCCLQAAGNGADVRPLLERPSVSHAVRAMRKALKISNDESEQMARTMEEIAPLLADVSPTVARQRRFLAKPTAGLSRRLMEALARTGRHQQRIEALQVRFQSLEQLDNAPPPLLTGDDLVAAGLQPGPLFKSLLDEVYDAQLESRVSSPQQARDLALALARSAPRS